eukprot:13120603-Ditylum_brightwellii.AAC.1
MVDKAEDKTAEDSSSFTIDPNATFANMKANNVDRPNIKQTNTSAIPDTGCNHHTGNLQMPSINKQETPFRPQVRVPNDMLMKASHELNLPIPALSPTTTHTNTYPNNKLCPSPTAWSSPPGPTYWHTLDLIPNRHSRYIYMITLLHSR